jgi:hypothetical protein
MELEKFALLLTIETPECISEISRGKLLAVSAWHSEKRRFFDDTGPARNASCGEQTEAFAMGTAELKEWLCDNDQ